MVDKSRERKEGGVMSIKLCICDVGGVIVTNFQTLGRIAAKYHIDLETLASDYQAYDMPLMDGTITTKGYWEHVACRFGLEKGHDPLVEQFEPMPIASGVKLVKALKAHGLRVVGGSNTCAGHWELMEKAASLDTLFDKTYLSYLMHVSKPCPEFFLQILSWERVVPEEVLFVDDSEQNIESAARLGIRAEQFKDTFRWTAVDRILYGLGFKTL